MAMNGVHRTKSNDNETRKKVYKATDCYFTSDLEKGNPYTIGLHNMVTIYTFLIPVAAVLADSYNAGRLYFDLNGYIFVLGYPSEWLTVAFILLMQFTLAFIVYYCFLAWVACYKRFGRTATVLFLLLFIATIAASRYAVFHVVFKLDLHPAGRITCCIQQLILSMKWISFVYENSYKVFHPWNKDDETGPAVWYGGQMEPQIGSFSSYVYFLFCPVLLYRDRYPRKPSNFWKALSYFSHFLIALLLGYLIFKNFLIPKSMHFETLMLHIMRIFLTGIIELYLANMCLMHGWMNGWAELLGFADQSFYYDWWNSRNLGEYLWKWNPVVHQWLKVYIHKNLKKWMPSIAGVFITLIISSLEHDLIISTGLGYFIPVYLIQYGLLSGIVLSLKPPLGKWMDQVTTCFLLTVGGAIQLSIYCTEVAARTNCPLDQNNTVWFSGLRMIDCYKKFNN